MILAQKIIRLRKQVGWSQEELAVKMNVSRQSVSKWESTNSIPDLNKIIMLSELFSVSTDFLLKDENEVFDSQIESKEPGSVSVNLEQALRYVEAKAQTSLLTAKGVIFCVCSVIPLFFFLALASQNQVGVSENMATGLGIICLLLMVCFGITFFIKTNQYEHDTAIIDSEKFELAYGVHSVYSEKLQEFRPTYNRRLSIAVLLFIFSFVPLMVSSMFFQSYAVALMMLNVLFSMVAIGIYLIIPISSKYDAFNNLIKDHYVETEKSKRTKRAEKLAVFYWPLLIAVYLGWSLWTMNWGITWIVWPVGSVLFIALIGLMELLEEKG